MTSTISFRVEAEVVDDAYESAPYMRVHVVPLIDGEPYIADYKGQPFEALCVYAMDLDDGEVGPFSCECGFAGCAGFFEPMDFVVNGSSVHWKFPDEPYVDLAVRSDGTEKPRQISFERAQYVDAFRTLITELKRL